MVVATRGKVFERCRSQSSSLPIDIYSFLKKKKYELQSVMRRKRRTLLRQAMASASPFYAESRSERSQKGEQL